MLTVGVGLTHRLCCCMCACVFCSCMCAINAINEFAIKCMASQQSKQQQVAAVMCQLLSFLPLPRGALVVRSLSLSLSHTHSRTVMLSHSRKQDTTTVPALQRLRRRQRQRTNPNAVDDCAYRCLLCFVYCGCAFVRVPLCRRRCAPSPHSPQSPQSPQSHRSSRSFRSLRALFVSVRWFYGALVVGVLVALYSCDCCAIASVSFERSSGRVVQQQLSRTRTLNIQKLNTSNFNQILKRSCCLPTTTAISNSLSILFFIVFLCKCSAKDLVAHSEQKQKTQKIA